MPVTLAWLALTFPAELTPDTVLAFTRLLTIRPLHGMWRQADPVVCEVVATGRAVRWQIGMTPREAAAVMPQLRGQLPDVAAEPTERLLPPIDAALELRLSSHTRPLRTDVPEAVAAAVLTALTSAGRDEALVLQWVIGPWLARPAVARGDRASLLGPELAPDEITAIRAKLAEPVYGTVGRIGVHAASPARRVQLAQRVVGALEVARAPGVAFTIRATSGPRAATRLIHHRGPLVDWPAQLNAAELAAVIGWPIGNPTLPGVTYSGHRQLPPSPGLWTSNLAAPVVTPGRFRVLGQATYPGRQGLVHLPPSDALHHLQAIGATGTGKSVALSHLIEADVNAGRSVVVIEPKADLVAAVLDRIPERRTDDVVLIDPADPEWSVGLNVLSGSPELAADRFVHVVRTLHPESWGPRTSQVLYAAALTLSRGGHTLAELPHLLTDSGYRARLVAAHPDPLGVGPFWAWYDSLSGPQRANVIGPSMNRLSAFLGRPAIRAMVGQDGPRFSLRRIFRERPIVLVNLAKGLIGPEAARLLGALVLSQLWQAALGRAVVAPERRHPVMVYVDEFADYTAGLPVDFGDILTQARGLGVALTVAHQGLHQLDTATRAGVLSNARSRLVFQTTAEAEARALAAALGGGLTPADLGALGAFEGYATLLHDHATRPSVSLVTLPPSPALGTAEAVRERSREQWATPVADVDAAILARRQLPPDDQPNGRRRRPQQ
jgi:hypothetical protein